MLSDGNRKYISFIALLMLLLFGLASAKNDYLDLSQCVLVTPPGSGRIEDKAITVLVEEIRKRTGIQIDRSDVWPEDQRPVIAVGQLEKIGKFAGPLLENVKDVKISGNEGFYLKVVENPRAAVLIAGKDERGVLYGVGRLLRKMILKKGLVHVPAELFINTTPAFELRGHQLGYRPKTNAYDAWSVDQFDQYIRELALFGTNSIEIIPPVSDDAAKSRHMSLPPMDMMIRMSEIIDSYGMDVWIWYPNVGDDYTSPDGIARELEQRKQVFRKLEHIDALLVPAGDPGHLDPGLFFEWLEKVAPLLNRYHPDAKIWVSPQAMAPTRNWLDEFYKYVNQKPQWLGGVVFAPWVKTPIREMRSLVDKQIKIRRYPDITHNVACQYPVKDWDIAFALTLHRECFNPRPTAMKKIHNRFDEFAIGSITYSEGINDDVNKFIWGDQDWNPETLVIETLRDYGRLFISPDMADNLAQGFMMQEQNWVGPLLTNEQVDITLAQWQQMEKTAPGPVLNNYRFQMGLMRGCYDAVIRKRLIYETSLEMQAMEMLRSAFDTGSLQAIRMAKEVLAKAGTEPVAVDLKKKCEALGDSLFKGIGAQLSVKRHGAASRTRGAFLDGINEPLNNALWLNDQFDRIVLMKDEKARLDAITRIVNRTNPGPGGFYDNMGSAPGFNRIRSQFKWEEDPGSLESPRIAYFYNIDVEDEQYIPLAWKNQAGTLYDTPLELVYENLDPDATYKVRVTYTGKRQKRVKLTADNRYLIHHYMNVKFESDNTPHIREFNIPYEATQDGRLLLVWKADEGERGAQVSEIWLIKNLDSN